MSRSVDAIVIGSGHNGVVAAAYLARAGWSVEVLERNDAPGGAVATEELTAPGYRHDTFSSWHPLFHASARLLRDPVPRRQAVPPLYDEVQEQIEHADRVGFDVYAIIEPWKAIKAQQLFAETVPDAAAAAAGD